MTDAANKERIRTLNDQFRANLKPGRVLISAGVQALGQEALPEVLDAVQKFAAFSPDNDPHREHDFGSFEYEGTKLFWKIDYYDAACQFGSDDPADPANTTRVLTIMLAVEY